jgi:predicted nuclease of predicted toxin-antitoxin system
VKFLADMGVSATVVRELRTAGHDAIHLEELGLRTLSDIDIFHMARDQGRVVLTFDLDFADIAVATDASLPSVIVFRLRFGRSKRVLERISAVLTSAAPALERGAFVVVDETRIRIRLLPLIDRA